MDEEDGAEGEEGAGEERHCAWWDGIRMVRLLSWVHLVKFLSAGKEKLDD